MSARWPRGRLLAAGVAVLAVFSASSAGATGATLPVYVADSGGFSSVLAYGQGQTVTASELAKYEALGTVPRSFVNEAGLYNSAIAGADHLTASNLSSVFKPSSFLPENAPGSILESPTPGVVIARDPTYQVPRIYGQTRAKVMWGAGFAQAQDRLFFMDVLRRVAEGTLAALLGPSAVPGDSAALGINDLSPAALTAEADALPATEGAQGAQALADMTNFVAGINAYIQLTRTDPAKYLPAEYPALGTLPTPWTLADTVAEAYLLIGQFTVSGGGAAQQALILDGLRARLGTKEGDAVYTDLRNAENPTAPTTTSQYFPSNNPTPNGRSEALLDPGSMQLRNAVVSTSPAAPPVPGGPNPNAAPAPAPAWVRELARTRLALPHEDSNAILVSAAHSTSGHPLAVMGPQVGYYSPEILMEEELHAPGIQIAGIVFPGATPYPVIGHGLDFAWTGTTAMGDNQDVYAELLCNPDGSPASYSSTHYVYKGACIPFTSRRYTETTPYAPTSPTTPPESITLATLSSVHGPVFAYAKAGTSPVALTTATAVYHHAVRSVIAFMLAAEDRIDSPASFIAAFRQFTGNENWFYLDSKNIAWIQSGWFPVRAPGTDIDVPIWGTGQFDWQGFNPTTFAYDRLPPSANPTATNPPQGYLISWNNKAAPGWQAPPGVWVFGSVQRVSLLEDPLVAALARGKLTLAEVARVNLDGATRDLHGAAVLPSLLRVLGTPPADLAGAVSVLQAWTASGAHRRDTTGKGYYNQSAAVLLMDAWWPQVISGIFAPTLGSSLLNEIGSDELAPLNAAPTYSGYFNGWDGQVLTDLQQVLGERVADPTSRVYCGGGSLSACRAILAAGLRTAIAEVTKAQGTAVMANWRKPVFCPNNPSSCDEIVPTAAGAVATPAQPFENRGTYQQAVEITSSVGRGAVGFSTAPARTQPARPSGHPVAQPAALALTGGDPALPGLGLALLVAAGWLARRRRAAGKRSS
ncbi:MAG: penicillin acylase family protein [Mycobacteriales bacterium]